MTTTWWLWTGGMQNDFSPILAFKWMQCASNDCRWYPSPVNECCFLFWGFSSESICLSLCFYASACEENLVAAVGVFTQTFNCDVLCGWICWVIDSPEPCISLSLLSSEEEMICLLVVIALTLGWGWVVGGVGGEWIVKSLAPKFLHVWTKLPPIPELGRMIRIGQND